MEGLSLGPAPLRNADGFYDLCRAVLVKSEADYDKFDAAFLEYFKDVPFPEELLPDELMDWLNHPKKRLRSSAPFCASRACGKKSIDEILKMFEERLREQTEEHNGGSYWIGTGGYSNFGNAGHSPPPASASAARASTAAPFRSREERKYRDFRRDNTLDIRQFQMAFRLLRQYSDQSLGDKTECSTWTAPSGIPATTRASLGAVCYKPRGQHRQGADADGLRRVDEPYARLCSMLFQAARQSNHFKELHVYYFHNCVYCASTPTRGCTASTAFRPSGC